MKTQDVGTTVYILITNNNFVLEDHFLADDSSSSAGISERDLLVTGFDLEHLIFCFYEC